MVCIAVFTFEFIVRTILSPRSMISMIGLIDLLAILPYYISLCLVESTDIDGQPEERSGLVKVVLGSKAFRILKLARYSVTVMEVGLVIRKSYQELCSLILSVVMGVVIFGTFFYYME